MIDQSRLVAPAAAAVAILLSASVAAAWVTSSRAADAVAVGERPGTVPPPLASPPRPSPAVQPTAVAIPAIELEAPVDPVGLTGDRQLAVPDDAQRVGWWSGGATAGEPGPTVLVGHVDDTTGPAVFFPLRELEPGQQVQVTRADGAVATYAVDRSESHPKDRFPTLAVYGPTDEPTLRLITCTGRFDRRAGHYEDNLVVFATQVP